MLVSHACKISVGANGSQDTQQIVGAANTDECWAGHHISRVAFGVIVLGWETVCPISLAEVAAPVQSCSYESIPTCTCNMHMRVPPRAMNGNGCERDQRIGLGGGDDTCIRYGVWLLVASPPSASPICNPLDSQDKVQNCRQGDAEQAVQVYGVVTSIISLRVPIISHRHTGKEPGEGTIRKSLPSILWYCISLLCRVSFFFFLLCFLLSFLK